MTNLNNFRTSFERDLGATGSHIESEFLAALCRVLLDNGYEWGRSACDSVVGIVPQYVICRYRVDFLISFEFYGSWLHLIVECDGHEFHERTKKQAQRDRRRDRELANLGYSVLRFTGSEINGGASQCASEVLARIMDFQTMCLKMAVFPQENEAA